MAHRPLRLVAVLAGACLAVTACTSNTTEVSNQTAPTASPLPSPPATDPPPTEVLPTDRPTDAGPTTPATEIAPPDLSGQTVDCSTVPKPCDHGDDPQLDELWDRCAAGEPTACDRLYYDSPFDTRYEQFGNTCGDRGLTVPCPASLE